VHDQFLFLSIVWVLLSGILTAYLWRHRHTGVGVVLTYLIFLTSSHFLQGLIYSFPWYQPLNDPSIIYSGYIQSLIGLTGLTTGIIFIAPALRHKYRPVNKGEDAERPDLIDQSKVTIIYIVTGILTYLVLTPLLGNIPTLGAFLSGLQRLYHAGIVLIIWQTLNNDQRNLRSLLVPSLLIVLWPVTTITRDGFLGFGIIPTTLMLVFVAFRFMKAKTVLLIAPFFLFLGMSLITTYFVGRDEIRNIVWGGSNTDTRVTTVFSVFTEDFQVFDIFNPEHLYVIDIRLALNQLIGLGVNRLESGAVEYANGSTISDAMLMVLPRALWPDKPMVVGGQALVNQYTGLYFYGSTSVGLGQVLEAYVNFGSTGVFFGFIVIGVFLSTIDKRVSSALANGNFYQVAVWLVPVFGLWLVEDNLITTVGSAISGVITVIVFNTVLRVVTDSRQSKLPAGIQQAIPDQLASLK